MVPPKKYTDIVNQRTVKIQFPGPPKAGTYNFSLFVKSDSVVGSDIRQEIKLHVKDSSALPAEPEIDDDISEPDEDSIAGQMKLMREQGLTGALAGGSGAAGEKEKGKSTAEDSDSDSSDDD
ncbi:hypothetical protein BC936DRAFT_140006 [Jimgerdemannia flammicorona]|uniref:Uncharacterized protein n=2 Tax=Jimgerdemannia flammicorona TaxID=994334 RepID=A0A433Q2C6_9FUNG|nr:hypothetical protein BC936DRAFT_140006 [Jimgerdemannia flammicorona]RUS23973.1 hypothetical protein BC938DRAFT_474325 [Jimgerdemannia flammicorona]